MQKDERRVQYAPKSYPGLIDDIDAFLKAALGLEVYQEAANEYRKKLRSSTAAVPTQRHVPRFLRVVLSPDKELQHLGKVSSSNSVAFRWDAVEEYAGSMANGFHTQSSVVQ